MTPSAETLPLTPAQQLTAADLLRQILRHSDNATLAVSMRVGHSFYSIASSILYFELRIGQGYYHHMFLGIDLEVLGRPAASRAVDARKDGEGMEHGVEGLKSSHQAEGEALVDEKEPHAQVTDASRGVEDERKTREADLDIAMEVDDATTVRHREHSPSCPRSQTALIEPHYPKHELLALTKVLELGWHDQCESPLVQRSANLFTHLRTLRFLPQLRCTCEEHCEMCSNAYGYDYSSEFCGFTRFLRAEKVVLSILRRFTGKPTLSQLKTILDAAKIVTLVISPDTLCCTESLGDMIRSGLGPVRKLRIIFAPWSARVVDESDHSAFDRHKKNRNPIGLAEMAAFLIGVCRSRSRHIEVYLIEGISKKLRPRRGYRPSPLPSIDLLTEEIKSGLGKDAAKLFPNVILKDRRTYIKENEKDEFDEEEIDRWRKAQKDEDEMPRVLAEKAIENAHYQSVVNELGNHFGLLDDSHLAKLAMIETAQGVWEAVIATRLSREADAEERERPYLYGDALRQVADFKIAQEKEEEKTWDAICLSVFDAQEADAQRKAKEEDSSADREEEERTSLMPTGEAKQNKSEISAAPDNSTAQHELQTTHSTSAEEATEQPAALITKDQPIYGQGIVTLSANGDKET